MGFVHLNVQTDYSFLTSSITVEALLSRVKEFHMNAVAITDHMNLFGAIPFYQKAKKLGIQPLFGAKIFVVDDVATTQHRPDWDGLAPEGRASPLENGIFHLTILAKNAIGYQNLCRLLTKGYESHQQQKPVISRHILGQYHEGLLLMSGTLRGDIASLLLQSDHDRARARAREYQDIFGDDFYLEAQSSNLKLGTKLLPMIAELSKDLSIPVVATNDCHYLTREDAGVHKILLNIGRARTLQDADHARFESDEHFLKSEEDMRRAFAGHEDWCDRTVEVAAKCKFEYRFSDEKGNRIYHLPVFETEGRPLAEYLREKAFEGFQTRSIAPELRSAYESRLNHELEVIRDTGFSGYFLIVADFINWAKSHAIPVGPGRGSGVGSLVSYFLGITDLDPEEHGLLFERFLNPERISMPDFDIDFCMDRRDEVIQYVRNKYGIERVAKIINFGKMQARAVLRDVGRVFGVPHEDMDRFAKLIPMDLGMTLEKALEMEPRIKEVLDHDPRMREVMDHSLALEGMHRHAGIHAAGVIIADAPITDYCPLYQSADGDWMTHFDGKYSEEVGLIKFDFLGLKTLTAIQKSEEWVRKRKNPEFSMNKLSLTDAQTYELISQGDTIGVFQLEGHGMQDLCRRIVPTTFNEITAINALYRPGPLGMGMHEEFIRRKKGEVPVTYEIATLEPILQETYGIVIYQEQVQRIAVELASYTLGGADILRRAMGKKKIDEMAHQRAIFLEGAAKNGHPAAAAARIFDLMESFAQYGFNKSHAAAYMMVAYHTAYLKKHYPVEFYVGTLSTEMGKIDKMTMFVNDIRGHQIQVLPPDINESDWEFLPIGDRGIRFGLGAIKGLGHAAVIHLCEVRKKGGPFHDMIDLLHRVDTRILNKKGLESLIKAGALDCSKQPRARMMAALGDALKEVDRSQHHSGGLQGSLFGEDQVHQNRQGFWNRYSAVSEWDIGQKLQLEFDTVGAFLTGHPLEKFLAKTQLFVTGTLKQIRNKRIGDKVTIAGVVKPRERRTKKGDKMAILQVEDMEGAGEVVVFPQAFQKYESLIRGREPLLMTGKLEEIDPQGRCKLTIGSEGSIRSLEHMESPKADLHITLRDEKRSDLIMYIGELLKRYPGQSVSHLHIESPRGVTHMKLPRNLHVNLSEQLVADLVNLCGRESVRFELSS